MIVFCHLLNDNSGSPNVLRMVIDVLAREDRECRLFVGSQGSGCLEGTGIPITRYWYRRSRFRIITLLTYLYSQFALYRALSRADLPSDALIYVNTLLPFGGALWGHINGRRVVYHAHEVSITPAPLRWLLLKFARSTARSVIYVSRDQYERLPVEGVRPVVVPNPIAPQFVNVGSETPFELRRSGAFEVLMLASPRDYKGLPEFLELARRFVGTKSVHFALVLNSEPEEAERYLRLRACPENVTVHPRTDYPGPYYAQADVLLNLSRVDMCVETFGLTIVEAMAFGVPVIVPPVGGPAEIVTDGEEGFLVDSRDADRLEAVLSGMMKNPDKLLRMSKAARLRALDFTHEIFGETLKNEILALRAGAEKNCRKAPDRVG